MTFFKSIFINLFVLAFIVGCSGKVEDKNAGLSRAEKDDLREQKVNNSIEISSVSFVAQNEIKENETADSNIVGKYYAVKVCLKDKNLAKGLGNRSVEIEGERKTTDSDGCIIFDHEIAVNYNEENRCNIFEKTISFGKNKKRKINYSIDHYNNEVADLDKTRGCRQGSEKKNSFSTKSALILDDVSLIYERVQTKVRSDIRWIDHQTKIESCLKVKMTGNPLSRAHIRLTAHNRETNEIVQNENKFLRTKENGCFTTDIVTKYEQFRTSHYMNLDLKLDILSGPLAGESIKRTVYINPWEPSRHTYGIGQEGRVPVVRHKFKNKYARFHMDGVMYIQIGNSTNNMKVNDYLGLTISKMYQVVLNPYVYKEHRLTTGSNGPLSPYERLMHEGQFKLSMVILAPKNGQMEIDRKNYDDFEFITGIEKVVTVKNGIINTLVEIPFKMNDLPRLAVRTMSLLKIEPLGNTGLQSSVVTGFFKARIPWIKTNVLQAPDLNFTQKKIDKSCSVKNNTEADDCLSKIQDIKKSKISGYKEYSDRMFAKLSRETAKMNAPFQMKISPKKIFVNHLKKNFNGIEIHTSKSINNSYGINFKASDFDALMPQNQTNTFFTDNMKEELCRYGFHQNGAYRKLFGLFYVKKTYKDCLKRPEKYFGVKATRHIENIEGTGNSFANGSSIFLGERRNVNNGENDSETISDSWYIGGDFSSKIPIPFVKDFLNLGLKAGRSRNWTTAHAKQKGYQFSEDIGTSKNLGVEKFVVDVKANFQRCILVKSNDFLNVELAHKRRAEDFIGLGGPNTAHLSIADMSDEDFDYYNPQTNLNMSFYICDEKLKSETFTESWYFIQSHIDSALARDYDGVDERRILKSFRGNQSYLELRDGLREINSRSLLMDNIGHNTPEDVLVRNWGHLLKGGVSEKDSAKYLIEHVEGSFPGTIEGNGFIEKPTN